MPSFHLYSIPFSLFPPPRTPSLSLFFSLSLSPRIHSPVLSLNLSAALFSLFCSLWRGFFSLPFSPLSPLTKPLSSSLSTLSPHLPSMPYRITSSTLDRAALLPHLLPLLPYITVCAPLLSPFAALMC
jgi:hypothetical protein